MIMVLNNKGRKTELCKERYLFGTIPNENKMELN